MSKKERDERNRENYLERRRMQRESSTQRKRKSRKRTSTPKTSSSTTRKSTSTTRTISQRAKTRKESTPRPITRRDPTPVSMPKDDYSAKLSSIKSELNSLSFRTRNMPESVNQLGGNINEISTRIQNIRKNRYHSQKNLEQMSTELEKNWNSQLPNIQSYSLEQSNLLLQRQNNLDARIDRTETLDELIRFGNQLSDISRDFTAIEGSLRGQLDDFQSRYQQIDDDLRTAELTASNLANTSIGWKNNEHPVLAVKVKDLTNDVDGVLTLTNLRILFEDVKEEVIRKNLLFATEKKTIREVTLNQPIGSIEEIEKGRVGFFKGAGLFFKFKPKTGLDELKIDTSGNEDDDIIHFYNFIISGEAEEELEPVKKETEDNIPVVCPNCSAPYREEILRGQTSVKCIYCGSVIKL